MMINAFICEHYEKDNELIVFLKDAILDLFGLPLLPWELTDHTPLV